MSQPLSIVASSFKHHILHGLLQPHPSSVASSFQGCVLHQVSRSQLVFTSSFELSATSIECHGLHQVSCPPPTRRFSSIKCLRLHLRVASFVKSCNLVIQVSQPLSIVASSFKHHVLHGLLQPHPSSVASSFQGCVLHQVSRSQSAFTSSFEFSATSIECHSLQRVSCRPPSFSLIDCSLLHSRVASFLESCNLVIQVSQPLLIVASSFKCHVLHGMLQPHGVLQPPLK